MDTPPSPTPLAAAPRATARALESYLRLPGSTKVQSVVYFLYYLGIIIGLLLIYGRGDFTTAPFVYQGF